MKETQRQMNHPLEQFIIIFYAAAYAVPFKQHFSYICADRMELHTRFQHCRHINISLQGILCQSMVIYVPAHQTPCDDRPVH
jgi:hypothetical protein